MKYLSQFRGLPKQIYKICLCRIIMSMGSMSYAFSSVHFRGILNLSEVQVAWILLLTSVCNISTGLYGGRLADIYGRKKVCVISYCLQILCHIISIFLCRTLWMIPLMLLANAFAFVGHPTFSAMVSDAASPDNTRECFSLMYLCSNIGVAIGPAIGGLLFYKHLELTYVMQAFFVGLGILIFALTCSDNYNRKEALEKAKEQRKAQDNFNEKEVSLLQILRQHKLLLIFVLSLSVVSICYQMVNYMLSMQTTDLFGLETSSKFAGFVWTANGIVIIIFTPFLLNLTRKNHHFVNMAIGVLLYSIGYGSYSFMKTPYMVIIGAVIWSLGEILISTGSGAFISANSPASHVARCQSLYETSRAIGKAIGPLIFGYLLSFINYNSAWRINSVICILVSLWVYTSWKKAGKPKE